MEFTEVRIVTTTAGIELLTGFLTDMGHTGFVVEDPADFERFLNDTEPHWDYVDDALLSLRDTEPSIRIYCAANAQGEASLTQIRALTDRLRNEDTEGLWGSLEITLATVCDDDWADAWKKYFKPFPVGNRLFIRPSWEDAVSPADRLTLQIDPESAFGTGAHETTRLCMEALESAVQPGARALDLGCGSGILSIAMLLLGAAHVTALDIDENAVRIARQNLEKNGLSPDSFKLHCGNVLADKALADSLGDGYDVIAANIVADVIIALCPLFSRCLKSNGHLVVSGIIGERAREVEQALSAAGFRTLQKTSQKDWVCLLLTHGAQ